MKKVIVGSPDVSSFPVISLNNYCSICLVIWGAGEKLFRDLLNYCETKINIQIIHV